MPNRQLPSPPHPPHCSIVPPYLLEALASSDDPHLAAHAQATLDVDAERRASRRTAGLRPERPAAPRAAGWRRGTADGPLRAIHDAKHGTTLPGTLVRSEGEPDTGDQGVTEAYDGLGATWQLWQEAYGRNSLDGKGLPLVATVHFGTDYDNAFWDGTQMVFGDGDGVIFLPFTRSVDVIGHELAHGVTQYTSGLNYQDQSGALNESVSDVFGVLVKQRLLGQSADQADWLVGAELLAPGVNGVALRSMAAPGTAYDDPRLGKDPQPAHLRDYVDTTDDNGGVHINSGIPNKAFHVVRHHPGRQRLGGRRPGLGRHHHRRHQRRLRLRHLRPAHRRRGHRPARRRLRGRRRGAGGLGCRGRRAGPPPHRPRPAPPPSRMPARAPGPAPAPTRRPARPPRSTCAAPAGSPAAPSSAPWRWASCPTATPAPGSRCSPTTACPPWPSRLAGRPRHARRLLLRRALRAAAARPRAARARAARRRAQPASSAPSERPDG